MNVYLTMLLLFGLALVQSTVLPRVTLWGVHPELMLMVVISWSILSGAEEGMLWALIGGIPLDLLSAGTFGLHTLALLLVSFLSGLGESTIFRSDLLMPLLIIPLATLGYELALLGGLYLTGWSAPFGAYFSRAVLPSMLLNTLLMAPIYLILRALHRCLHREEIVL
ncbi:MAG: rod shape-determining protein MreD [Anaerolineae bacterium]|nr:rod shape-determining protein MreD [Anaerolineae bacterium]